MSENDNVSLFAFDPGQVATASGLVYFCHGGAGICVVKNIAIEEPFLAIITLEPIRCESIRVENFRRLDFTEFERIGFNIDFKFLSPRRGEFISTENARKRQSQLSGIHADYSVTSSISNSLIVEDEHEFPVPSIEDEPELSPVVAPNVFRSPKPFLERYDEEMPDITHERLPRRPTWARPMVIRKENSRFLKPRPINRNLSRNKVIMGNTRPKNVYKCPDCPEKVTSLKKLRKHSYTTGHGDQRPFECDICDKRFKWHSEFNRHKRRHEGTLVKFHCQTCNKGFDCRSRLTTHQLGHTDARPYICETCGLTFKWPAQKRLHKAKEHNLGSEVALKTFKCDHCDKWFNSDWARRHHSIVHSKERPYTCQNCEKTFKYQQDLKKHQKEQHSGYVLPTPFVCEVCHKAFSAKSRLDRHTASHTEERPHKCEFCEKDYKTVDILQKHLKVFHADIAPGTPALKCEICAKLMVSQSRLKLHMITHTTERPHICKLCGKPFKDPRSLKIHEQTHEDGTATPRPSPLIKRPKSDSSNLCPICGKQFGTRRLLVNHEKIHQSDCSSNISCRDCGESFPNRSELLEHRKTNHFNKRTTFECDHCQNNFKMKWQLIKHVEKIHNDILSGQKKQKAKKKSIFD